MLISEKMNKKGMSLSIMLLTLLTLVLVVTTLFYFNVKRNKEHEKLLIPKVIDEVYVREAEINFYINDMIKKSITEDVSEGVFLNNFKIELNNSKDKQGNYIVSELEQLKGIDEEDVEIKDGKLFFEVSIKIEDKLIDDYEVISVSYNFNKVFEKDLV